MLENSHSMFVIIPSYSLTLMVLCIKNLATRKLSTNSCVFPMAYRISCRSLCMAQEVIHNLAPTCPWTSSPLSCPLCFIVQMYRLSVASPTCKTLSNLCASKKFSLTGSSSFLFVGLENIHSSFKFQAKLYPYYDTFSVYPLNNNQVNFFDAF